MNDIVEQLRAERAEVLCAEAADEIESLRQQVKDWERGSESGESKLGQLEANERVMELEEELKQLCFKSINQLNELAALKQGEPVVTVCTDRNGSIDGMSDEIDDLLPVGTPLYTSAPTIPEGWQIVPVEPTYQMAAQGLVHHPFERPDLNTLAWAYKAMLTAAPKNKTGDIG